MSAEENPQAQKDIIIKPFPQKEMFIKTTDRKDDFDVLISFGVDNLTEKERASLRQLLEKTTVHVGLSRTKPSWHLIVFMVVTYTISIFVQGIFAGRSIWS